MTQSSHGTSCMQSDTSIFLKSYILSLETFLVLSIPITIKNYNWCLISTTWVWIALTHGFFNSKDYSTTLSKDSEL